MKDHPFQEALRRVFGLIAPWRVAVGLERIQDAVYRGRVTIEGRDVMTGLEKEVSISLDRLQPPADPPSTPAPA